MLILKLELELEPVSTHTGNCFQLTSKTWASCFAIIRKQFDSILTSLIQFALQFSSVFSAAVRLVLGKKTHVFRSSLFF